MIEQIALVGEETEYGNQGCREYGCADSNEGRPPDDCLKPLYEMGTKSDHREEKSNRGQVEIAFA